MTWAVGGISASTPAGPKIVAGWTWKSFGLDFRPAWDEYGPWGACWVLTHLPTGRAICGMVMALAEAQAVAEDIDGWADWSAIDALNSRFLASRGKDLKAKLGPRFVRGLDTAVPWGDFSVEVARPELIG